MPLVVDLEAKLLQVVADAVRLRKVIGASRELAVAQLVPDETVRRPIAFLSSGRQPSGNAIGARHGLRRASLPTGVVCIGAAPPAPVTRLPAPRLIVDGDAEARQMIADPVALRELVATAGNLAVE
jgi:hypothetical protein